MGAIHSGDRVRLRAPNPILALRSLLGRVVTSDRTAGYWIIELDAPADYVNAEGDTVHLRQIREHAENLVVLKPSPTADDRARGGGA